MVSSYKSMIAEINKELNTLSSKSAIKISYTGKSRTGISGTSADKETQAQIAALYASQAKLLAEMNGYRQKLVTLQNAEAGTADKTKEALNAQLAAAKSLYDANDSTLRTQYLQTQQHTKMARLLETEAANARKLSVRQAQSGDQEANTAFSKDEAAKAEQRRATEGAISALYAQQRKYISEIYEYDRKIVALSVDEKNAESDTMRALSEQRRKTQELYDVNDKTLRTQYAQTESSERMADLTRIQEANQRKIAVSTAEAADKQRQHAEAIKTSSTFADKLAASVTH